MAYKRIGLISRPTPGCGCGSERMRQLGGNTRHGKLRKTNRALRHQTLIHDVSDDAAQP